MKNLITQEEFNKLGLNIENEYTLRNIKEQQQHAEEINKLKPCKLFFKIEEHDGQKYFQYNRILIEENGLTFVIKFDEYRKKYFIFCDNINDLTNLNHYTETQIRKEFTKPNEIGKLSVKKLNDWIKYETDVHNKLKEINDKNDDKKAQFLKSLEGHPVKWYNDGNSGEIIKNGLKFSFTIEKEYISKRIEIYYETSNDLETFLKLTDNKLNK